MAPRNNNTAGDNAATDKTKFRYTGSVSSTIEVDGNEIKLHNGAIIELPETNTKIQRLLAKQLVEKVVEQPAPTENTENN